MRTTEKILILFFILFVYNVSFADIDVFIDPGHGGSDIGSPTHITGYSLLSQFLSVKQMRTDLSTNVDISDLVYLVDFMFRGGPDPICYDEANIDADTSDIIDISDLVFLVNFMFNNGPEPDISPTATMQLFSGESYILSGGTIIGPPPIEPPLEFTTLTTNYENGFTTYTLDAAVPLRGLEFYIQSAESITPINLMTNNLDFLNEYKNGYLHIGVLDLNGDDTLSSEVQDILKVEGLYQISSAVAVDSSGNKINVIIQ